MVRFLCLSDIHEMSPRVDSGISGYAQRLARQVDADAILYHGDTLQGLWTSYNDSDKLKDRMGIDERELTVDQFQIESTQVLDNLSNGDVPVYAIAGNHDGITYQSDNSKRHEPLGIEFLESHPKVRSLEKSKDSVKGVEIGGVGSHREIRPGGATPIEYTEEQFKSHLNAIGNVDYLITHTPPFGTPLDFAPRAFPGDPEYAFIFEEGLFKGVHVGSRSIREFIDETQPRYNSHGHIHESVGVVDIGRTKALNCSFEGNHVVGLVDTEKNEANLLKLQRNN